MANTSPVVIANYALTDLGHTTYIQSLTESSREAKIINLHWDRARRTALSAFDWNFARRRQALAVHDEDPPTNDWSYRYVYPSDCLVPRKIFNPYGWNQDAVPFSLELDSAAEENTILTDLESAYMIYTCDQTNYNLYPEYFTNLLAATLGYYVAYPITNKLPMIKVAEDRLVNLLTKVPAQDANIGVERGPREADWIRARNFVSEINTIFNTTVP